MLPRATVAQSSSEELHSTTPVYPSWDGHYGQRRQSRAHQEGRGGGHVPPAPVSTRTRKGTGHRHRRSRPALARCSGSQDSSAPVASPHSASPRSPIRSGRGACGERKSSLSRHDIAGFAKGIGSGYNKTAHCIARAR